MFTEKLWSEWLAEELQNYKEVKGKKKYLKKGYTHFSHRFWLPDRFSELKEILQNDLLIKNTKLNRKEYWQFTPFLKFHIKTPRFRYQELEQQYDLETKLRPICFASHIDSLIFGFYAKGLSKRYEQYISNEGFDNCVLAYRTDLGKSNIQFTKEVFSYISNYGECTAIALDIKGYFDNIDHIILKEKWIKLLDAKLPEDQFRIYKVLTNYSYINKNNLLKAFKGPKFRNELLLPTLFDYVPGNTLTEKYTELKKRNLIVQNIPVSKKLSKRMTHIPVPNERTKGIPQGSPLSSVLSNVYLLDYDREMHAESMKCNFLYRRYCDDILIVCKTSEANRLKRMAITKISRDYHLTIQNKKVETIDFRLDSTRQLRAFRRLKDKPDVLPKINSTNEKLLSKPLQYLGFEFNGKSILIRSSSLSRYFRKMRSRIIKTVSMAYGASSGMSKTVFIKQLLEKYSHFGERNFITYSYNASKEFYFNSRKQRKEGLNSPSIKRQLSRHFTVLMSTLYSKNEQRIKFKRNRNKVVTRKSI